MTILQLHSEVLNSSNDSIIIFTQSEIIKFANSAASNLFGYHNRKSINGSFHSYDCDELIGKSISILLGNKVKKALYNHGKTSKEEKSTSLILMKESIVSCYDLDGNPFKAHINLCCNSFGDEGDTTTSSEYYAFLKPLEMREESLNLQDFGTSSSSSISNRRGSSHSDHLGPGSLMRHDDIVSSPNILTTRSVYEDFACNNIGGSFSNSCLSSGRELASNKRSSSLVHDSNELFNSVLTEEEEEEDFEFSRGMSEAVLSTSKDIRNDVDLRRKSFDSMKGLLSSSSSLGKKMIMRRRSSIEILNKTVFGSTISQPLQPEKEDFMGHYFSKKFKESMSFMSTTGGSNQTDTTSESATSISSDGMNTSYDVLQTVLNLTRGIIHSSFNGLLIFDNNGIIKLANEAATIMFEYSNINEIIGSQIDDMIGAGIDDNNSNREANETSDTSFMNKYVHQEYDASYSPVLDNLNIERFNRERIEILAKKKTGRKFRIELGLRAIHLDDYFFVAFIRDMTKQTQYEMDLMRKQQLTQSIVEVSFDALFLTTDCGTIRMVNEAAVNMFGYSRGELIGKNINTICATFRRTSGKQLFAGSSSGGKTSKKNQIRKRVDVEAMKKDGTMIPCELGTTEIKPFKSGDGNRLICGFIKDVTHQKQYEQDLKQKHELTMAMIDASYHAIIALDRFGNMRMVNNTASNLFKWTVSELEGAKLQLIIPDVSIQLILGSQRETIAKTKDNEEFPVMLSIAKINMLSSSMQTRGVTNNPNFGWNSVACIRSHSMGTTQQKKYEFVAFVRDLREQKKLMSMEIEKASSDALLHNMLPKHIVMKLKDDPSHIADHSLCTTVLFADIVGFTKMSSNMSPINLVKMLNELFSVFDELVDKYDLNKVKTIGDCYMVSSIPTQTDDTNTCCANVCRMALNMLEAIRVFNKKYEGLHNLNLRIGVNAGPVVAGVVGTKRFLYDLWGDAVNVASRMESTGVPGKIQVTKEVLDHVDNQFEFHHRGTVEVKGKGAMDTYFLIGDKKLPGQDLEPHRGVAFSDRTSTSHTSSVVNQ